MAPRLNFLPGALSKTLLDFQQEGVLFGISKNGKCLIGDEMGLGKTLQALSIAYYYKNEWPLLIVCPSSMRFPWIEEIEKWLPDIQPNEINLVLSGTDASNLKSSKISIVGYGLLSHVSSRLLINCLKDTKFEVVVVDESHYMKNRKAARTKALISVIKSAKRAVLLTGTPALARPEELYVQIDVLKPNLLGTFGKFAERFCEAHMEYVCGGRVRKWNTQGASNLDELHNILKTNVMIRRLKRHVLTQLPPKRRQRITFDLADSEFKKKLTDVITEFRKVSHQIRGQIAVPTDKNPVFEMMRLTTLLYKQTGLSKISAVRQYIADMLDNSDKKFLVFAHHLDVMKAIELEVVKKKVKYIRIAGDVPSAHRGSLVHQFQSDSTVRVAILSLLAASVGITLTSADHVIFAELHWTPGVMQQAEDRVHRIGQENSVLVQYLVAKGTIDEVLWRMVCNKVYVTTAALNGKLQGLEVEEASEGQSKLLEAFSAWVMEDEEEEVSEDEFLFTHSQKKRKQDALQRSLTEFFHSPSSSKCRKTDFGKEWSELPQSPSQEEEKCETLAEKELSTPKVEVCVVDEMDDDNSLRKTTRKTYKVAKKKSPEEEPKTRSKVVVAKVIIDGDEKVPDGSLFGPVGLTPECKPAHKTNKINVEEKEEKDTETDVGDLLSSYTRLLNKVNKPKLVDDIKGFDSTQVSSELQRSSFEDENSGSPKISEKTNKAVDIDIKEQNGCSRISELDNSVAREDCNPVEDFSSNEQPTTTSEISALSNDEDFRDFKSCNPWCCSLCTFNNNGFLAVCEMCETPRQRSRRKMTKTALATPEFVKRRQQRIFERCSVPEKKMKSRRNMSKREEDIVVCVEVPEEDIGSKGTARDRTTPLYQAEGDERKSVLHERPGNQSSKVAPLGTGAESRESSTSVDEDEAAPKIKNESEAEESDARTCDNTLSVVTRVGDELSDEMMTSGGESIEEAKTASEELFFPGDEFDDLTDEDWWLCGSCQKYNYDDTADHCELCGQAKTKPSDSVEDMVPNFGADWWRCEDCGEFYFNADVDTKCDKCEKPDSPVKKSFVEDWGEYRHLIIDDSHEGHVGIPRTVENLMFCLSRYTDRVYLYDENGEPLNCNVSLLDLESSNTENLPDLLTDTSNRKQALRFMRKWKSLKERQRRLLRKSSIIFEDPYEAVEAVKMGRDQKLCTNRFPSKEKLQAEVLATALENNGTVRHCTKTKQQRHRGASGAKNTVISNSSGSSTTTSTNQQTWIQAIDETGRPLCISCQAPVETKNTECLWDERFCSHKCKEDYQIRMCGSRVRQSLFEEEKGVCQRCRCDAHNLYRTIKFLPKPERRAYLENTSFLTLPVTLLNKIIIDPKEGMFWEADHVIPVVEGGGECGLENYRTLCVPCHRQATAELRQRLKTNRLKARPAGIPDITSFFNT